MTGGVADQLRCAGEPPGASWSASTDTDTVVLPSGGRVPPSSPASHGFTVNPPTWTIELTHSSTASGMPSPSRSVQLAPASWSGSVTAGAVMNSRT